MVLCVMLKKKTILPNFKFMETSILELQLLPILTNHRLCLVAMATIAKNLIFLESMEFGECIGAYPNVVDQIN